MVWHFCCVAINSNVYHLTFVGQQEMLVILLVIQIKHKTG